MASPATRVQGIKAAAKRSKWLVVAATIVKDARSGWDSRAGVAESTCGSTHATLTLDESLAYIDAVFDDYANYGNLTHAQLDGARVLELGTGDNLGVALRFLAVGAGAVVSTDRFDSRSDQAQQLEIYRGLLDRLGAEGRARVEAATGLPERFALKKGTLESRVGVSVEEADRLFEPESFDLIVSRAVLEHVYDPDAAFAAMHRLLRPGGAMLHKVDFRDHGMFTDGGMHPLTFLTIPDPIYTRMSQNSGRPNRRLADFYRAKLAELGYDSSVLVTRVAGRDDDLVPHAEWSDFEKAVGAGEIETIERIRPSLRPGFSRLSDAELAAAGIFIAARKQ